MKEEGLQETQIMKTNRCGGRCKLRRRVVTGRCGDGDVGNWDKEVVVGVDDEIVFLRCSAFLSL